VSFERLRETWTQLGERDAFWAVLAGRWGTSAESGEKEFFDIGEAEIVLRMHELRDLAPDLRRGTALDFGCGAGRLTRALSRQFERAVGVDIAPSMIQRAKELNRDYPDCEFFLNGEDLSRFGDETFDFVYSNLVLQHMPPELSRRYIPELFRVARRGSVVVFQLPSHFAATPAPPRTALAEALPGSARRAEFRFRTPLLRVPPASRVLLIVRVINMSDTLWPAAGREDGHFAIHVGNHWRSRWLKRLLQLDDGRGELPRDLPPGEETEVGLEITTPVKPGRYLLELEMVQEHVAWFGKPLRVPVRVERDRTAAAGLPPRMEMYTVPREEVEELIRRSGGELLDVRQDPDVGDGVTSLRYFARRG
jgi:SAM-dependent methyltransferase